MNSYEDKKEHLQKLRRQAEELSRKHSEDASSLSLEETHQLLHELQVHQIELELQNEEMRRAQQELEASRNNFLQLFHKAPVGYLVLDSLGIIRQANETFCHMVKEDMFRVKGQPFNIFISRPERQQFLARYRAVFRDPGNKNMEHFLLCADKETFYARIEAAAMPLSPDVSVSIFQEDPLLLLTISDITERRKADQKIAEYTRKLQQLYGQLDEEMDKARRVHEWTLPREFPDVPGLSFAACYYPAQRLGGDFYNVIKVDNKVILYLSDVMGHGMDGAMLSFFVKEAIDSYISLKPGEIHPEKIMRHLDRQYRLKNFQEEYHIGIFLAVLELETMEMSYCGAGFQAFPLVWRGDGQVFQLISKGLPISSVFPTELMDFKEEYLDLPPGTTIFFSTDGLPEQVVNQELYKERLEKVFSHNSYLPPDLIVQVIKEDFREFNQGTLQGEDDITFCILQVDPEQKKSLCLELESRLEELKRLQEEVFSILPGIEEGSDLFAGLHEMAANAVEHGNKFNPDKKVFVEITVTAEYLAATVEDQGDGFNWQDKLNNSLNLQGTEERGRGIIMTNMICQGPYYNEKGNRALIFVKK